jgi:hypothetical protein
VIHTVDAPLSKRPSIVIVRGSLLPGGGIVRLGGTGERTLQFRGSANLFHSRDEALEGINAGKVKPGDVVILRGLGVIGGPAMALTSAVVFALDGAKLIDKVAMITEGQLSGLVNDGLVVGEASPEAAAGGPPRRRERRHDPHPRRAQGRRSGGAGPCLRSAGRQTRSARESAAGCASTNAPCRLCTRERCAAESMNGRLKSRSAGASPR